MDTLNQILQMRFIVNRALFLYKTWEEINPWRAQEYP